MDDLTHPAWCDLAHCTATLPKPRYRAGETGFHRTAPVPLQHMPTAGYVVFDSEINPLLAHLEEAAPPWDTGPVLNIGTRDEPAMVSLPASHAEVVLRQLADLVAAAQPE